MAVSAADRREPRWAAARDLAEGTVLTDADLRPVRVQLGDSDNRYLSISEAVIGRTVHRPLRAGELLPRTVVGQPEPGVSVTIPLPSDNAPEIGRGDRITVWLSTKTCRGQVLLSGAPVQRVSGAADGGFGSSGGSVLVVTVPSGDAQRVVSALDLPGAVIRAGVLGSGQAPAPVVEDLTGCAGGSG